MKFKNRRSINWTLSVKDMSSNVLRSHLEVKLTDSPRTGERYVIASLNMPNYKMAATLLGRFGVVNNELINYLEGSFIGNQSKYLNILDFDINSNTNQN